MPWAVAAAVGAAAVGAAASSDSSRKASHAQQDATRDAIAAQENQGRQTRSDFAGQRMIGDSATGLLSRELGLNTFASMQPETAEQIRSRLSVEYRTGGGGNGIDDVGLDAAVAEEMQRQRLVGYGVPGTSGSPDLTAEVMRDPGYQFGLRQGQQALDRKAAAAGGRVSGAALKAASEYATNYATTGYNAAYQRRQDRLNRLASLANFGQTATGASAVAGSRSTNAISDLISGQGNATGAAQLAQGNIWGNTGNQLAATYQRYQQQQAAGYNGAVGAGAGQVNPSGGSWESGAYTGGADGTAALGWD